MHDNQNIEALQKAHMLDEDPGMDEDYPGRVSPFCRENIWRDYRLGMTVRELSLKYGLIPERVKAIVWMREIYWREVYPKMGETGLRLALEIEMMVGKEFGFVEYGADLVMLASREKGVKVYKAWRGDVDVKPSFAKKERIEKVLGGLKTNVYDLVPLRKWGVGRRGYMLFEKF